MKHFDASRHPVWLRALPVALVAGLLAQRLHWPLPWMIGPLLVTALQRVAGLRATAPRGGRQVGQWAIGTALGLYFTPSVVTLLAVQWLLIAGVASATLLIGLVSACLLQRLAGLDRATAYFCALPGGASEMAVLAEHAAARVDRVAAAHALRVVLVVTIVPFLLLHWAHVDAANLLRSAAGGADWSRMPLLLTASLAGGGCLLVLRISNAWVLGPLAAVALLSALGIALPALPVWAINGGQLLIGVSLGSRFSRDFFAAAPRFLLAVLACGLLGLVLALLLAAGLAAWSAVPWPTLLLAAAPGGVAEMSITAKVLQLGVPLVTACHVTRVVALTVGAQPLYRLLERLSPADTRPRP